MYKGTTPPVPNRSSSILFQANQILMRPISKFELRLTISNLKPSKAPGTDCLPNEYLKFSDENIPLLLLKLFNNILTTLSYYTNYPQERSQG